MHDLIELERQGWEALSSDYAAQFYDALMTEDAAMVLPIGVMDRSTALAGMDLQAPWDEYELCDEDVVPVGPDAAAVVYRARAVRGDEPYEAIMSSTYVRTPGGWRLALHQQSPVTE